MSTPSDKIDQIFCDALEIASEMERSAFLDQACGSDAELRRRVEKMLNAQPKAERFLEKPLGSFAPTLDQSVSQQLGTSIGPYKIIEEIGEGGMGVVYLAMQKEPVRRKVALKVIKPGMDSKQVVRRFEVERQALAMMDHPNIARVIDGGTTDSGRLYFVMELVKGIPITQYADQHRLSTNERLELFGDVCRAVQHAHQKGIIHRDLKPSNILVTQLDDKAIPKVIDFGIAKATNGQLMDGSLVTGYSQLVGTPMYMSPEQAEASVVDVDTRSDVYSLGVLLYELLTGTTPFDRKRMSSVSFDEFRRIVREEDPPRPSTRWSTLDAALDTVAEKHQANPRTLTQQVSGELDWIVMKALEKDRARRYESANELAKDVDRHLHDQPVEACPPSKVYRFGKFARRHRAALIGGTAVVLSAIIVLVGITLASLSQRKLADHRRKLADQRLQVQQEINNALTEVARLRGQFQLADQDDQSAVSRAREQAQRALALAETGPVAPELAAQVRQLADELDQEQRDRQLLAALDRAWLAQTQTEASQNRFLTEAAGPQLEAALLDYGITVGKDDPKQTASLVAAKPAVIRAALLTALDEWRRALCPPLGVSLSATKSGNIFVGWVVSQGAEDIKRGDHLVGIGQGEDGTIVDVRGRTLAEVGPLLKGDSSTVVQLEVIAPGQTKSRICMRQRDPTAAWLREVADLADSDPWRRKLRDSVEIQDWELRKRALEKLADEADVTRHPTRLLTGLASRLQSAGGKEQAIQLLTRVRAQTPGDLWVNASLGQAFLATLQHEEALRYCTAAVALQPESAGLRFNLATALMGLGRNEAAIPEFREAIRLAPEYAFAHSNLGSVLSVVGRHAEAAVVLREATRLQPDSTFVRCNLALALFYQGEIDEAQREIREAIRLAPDLAWAHGFLAWCLASPNKLDRNPQDIEQAILHARKAVELASKDPLQTIESHTCLGIAYYRKGTLDQAATHLTKVIELERSAEHKTDTGELDRAICMFFLAMTRWQLDNKDEARRWYDDAATWMKENKPDNPDLLRFRAEAADLLGIKETLNDETQVPEKIDAKSNMPKETPPERDESK